MMGSLSSVMRVHLKERIKESKAKSERALDMTHDGGACSKLTVRQLGSTKKVSSVLNIALQLSLSFHTTFGYRIGIPIFFLLLLVRVQALLASQSFFFLLFGNLLLDTFFLTWWQNNGCLSCFGLRILFFPVVLSAPQKVEGQKRDVSPERRDGETSNLGIEEETHLNFVFNVFVVELLSTSSRELGRGNRLLRLVVVF